MQHRELCTYGGRCEAGADNVISEEPSHEFGVIPVPAYGGFLACCPYALLMREDVREAWSAYRWWEKGQLALAYGGGIAVALRNAISALDIGMNHGEKSRADEMSKKHGK
jgi:hypothetical protein